MSELKILGLADVGGDRLEITYTDGEPDNYTPPAGSQIELPAGAQGRRAGRRLIAYGWVSATRNHFPAESYVGAGGECDRCKRPATVDGKQKQVPAVHQAGERHDDAKPRAMTEAELEQYALAIVRPQIENSRPTRQWLAGGAR